MGDNHGATRPGVEVVAENKVLEATARIASAVMVVVLPWMFYQVSSALKELEQVTSRIQILVARIEERDSRRAEQIDELRRRFDSFEKRPN